MIESVGTLAHRCGLCAGTPRWRLEREGDVIVTWACTEHLVLVLADLLEPTQHRRTALVTDLQHAG